MLKLFVLAAAALVAGPALAQETVIQVDPWSAFWSSIQAPLITFATAILTAAGGIVAFYANRYLGERTALAVNSVYQYGVDAAVGYLAKLLAKDGVDPASLTPASPEVSKAVIFARESYPETARIEPNADRMAQDILAGLGSKILGPIAGTLIGAAVKTVAAPRAKRRR